MNYWEPILAGLVGAALVFWLWPGAKRAMERSQEIENPDWMGALIPIAMVVLFVIVLVFVARS